MYEAIRDKERYTIADKLRYAIKLASSYQTPIQDTKPCMRILSFIFGVRDKMRICDGGGKFRVRGE